MTEDELRSVARSALHQAPPPWPVREHEAGHKPSDFDLNPDLDPIARASHPAKRAAVLVPIVAHTEATVLLTQRTDTLSRHAGQIAFPGGRIDPEDAGPLGAAIREAGEEIGLSPAHIEPLGYLDSYLTGTGFLIVPVVALIRPGFELTLNPDEVVSAFEVPLSFLLDRHNHRTQGRIFEGRERFFYSIPFDTYYIWGATAGIIRNMSDRLKNYGPNPT